MTTTIDISQSEEIYTVSQLNREVRSVLEGSFLTLWVEGEISNFVAPQSGHWYFSLKDATAQVRCAMFKPQNRRLSFIPQDGMHLLAKARVSLYEGRGDFQLLVEHMEEMGEGRLRQEFEALKKRLSEAGLFDPTHKKPLPDFPHTIGVITSPTGAAIRDILNVLRRRYPCAEIIIYPTLVQGDTAAPNITAALKTANRRKECDVLILARGGGSLEDLWPFNNEQLAYAIYQSNIPVISGIGHEIDFTIADFVADLRAPTPSAAAELATPSKEDLLITLAHHKKQCTRLMLQKLQQLQQQLTWTQKNLQQQHPKRRLAEQTQQLDFYELALIRLQNKIQQDTQTKLNILREKLLRLNPQSHIQRSYHQLNLQQQAFTNSIMTSLQHQHHNLSQLSATLDAMSPLATLNRGYSITTRAKDDHVLLDAKEVSMGDKIRVQLKSGRLNCIVDK